VQRTLGIKQRAKWDVARLPFDLGTVGATDIGDEMRAATLLASAKGNPNVPTPGLVGVPQPNLGDFQ
jgi:hypothetical protein